jgi:hypothetical protein
VGIAKGLREGHGRTLLANGVPARKTAPFTGLRWGNTQTLRQQNERTKELHLEIGIDDPTGSRPSPRWLERGREQTIFSA